MKMKKVISVILSFTIVLGILCAPLGESKGVKAASVPSNATLLNTYGNLLGHVGTCINPYQLSDSNVMKFVKSQYNSITMENEMKPDAVLRSNTVSISQAKSQGYYIPSDYPESKVPTLNFSTIDSVLKTCYQNGLKLRAHTLVWHSQTPDWYFRTNYSSSGSYVSQSVMNKRMEFYIKSVMNHVYGSQYGSVVYAWDVVNEYLNAGNTSGWQKIYGNVTTSPAFVKLAFQYAYDCLEYFKLTDSVSLFYNDYNTYMNVDKIITMVNYINSGKKICNGVGMQSHLSSSFPSASSYANALNKFVKQGYEVQITELDAKGNNDSDQANYYKSIMSAILSAKKAGGKITGITWWGLYDSVSWRKGNNPLLFYNLNTPKQSYSAVLQAYVDAGYKVGSSAVTPSQTPSVSPTTTPSVKPTTTPSVTPTVSPSTSPVAGLPSGITCQYSVVSDWGNSFQAQIVLKNNSSKTYNGWNLAFQYNSTITSLWGAELSSQSGTKVIVKNPSWDAAFAPGATVTINFIATLGANKNAPASYSFS